MELQQIRNKISLVFHIDGEGAFKLIKKETRLDTRFDFVDSATDIKIGNNIEGFSRVLIKKDEITIQTDELNTYPLYYYMNETVLHISNDIYLICRAHQDQLIIDEPQVLFFLKNGYFKYSSGFQNLYITKPSTEIKFKVSDKKIQTLEQAISQNAGLNKKASLEDLYLGLINSIEYYFKHKKIEIVHLTGGVDTRVILGALIELGYQDKVDFKTDFQFSNEPDLIISQKIAQKFKLNHITNCSELNKPVFGISGRYGSEFFAGDFHRIVEKFSYNEQSVYPELDTYLPHYKSTISDLYSIYQSSNVWAYPICYTYSTNLYSPYSSRLSLLSLFDVNPVLIKDYGFYNYLFTTKLSYLSDIPFYSNFQMYNKNFKFVEKPKSPITADVNQLKYNFAFFTADLIRSFINLNTLTPHKQAVLISRLRIVDQYFNKLILN